LESGKAQEELRRQTISTYIFEIAQGYLAWDESITTYKKGKAAKTSVASNV
jgi:hypothetical protein